MSRLERILVSWVLWLGACLGPLRGQTAFTLHALGATDRPQALAAIPQPAVAESLWIAVKLCSGAPVQPGGDLPDVKWFAGDLMAYDRFHSILAAWRPPDTIWVQRELAAAEPWLIAHELLHHLLRGPPGKDKHPFQPFWFPCQIMPAQHQLGGIGAAREGGR